MRLITKARITAVAALMAFAALAGIATGQQDIGLLHQNLNESQSTAAFGIGKILDESSTASLTAAEINANPAARNAGKGPGGPRSHCRRRGTQRRHDGPLARQRRPDTSDCLQRAGDVGTRAASN